MEKPDWMLPSEVAAMFAVRPRTVSRWAREGKLPSMVTPGKHRRFPRAGVLALHAAMQDKGRSE